ncbi:MAG: Na+/H+ antiporter subunit C [Verrucomicrobiota bacterium]
MVLLYSILIGALFGAGMYMLLRRSLLKIIIGLLLLSHGAHLLIFTAGGLTRGRPPLIDPEAYVLAQPYADPLPQALILTAIVIGFGVIAFALVLVHRVFTDLETDDTDDLKMTDT